MDVHPDKKVYSPDEQVGIQTKITNLAGQITGATLSLRALSSTEDWVAQTNINDVQAITLDGDYLWFATKGGVKRYNITTGVSEVFTTINGLASNDVVAIGIEGNFVWFGTRDNGVTRYDKLNNAWRSFTVVDGLVNDQVQAILVDGNYVWVASWNGATRYDRQENKWEIFRIADTQPGNNITAMANEGDFLWFATYDGVRRYDKKRDTWRTFTTFDGLPNSFIRAIVAESDYVWFGTDDGVGRLQTRGRTIWENKRSIDLTAQQAQTFPDPIGTVTSVGKCYLEALLVSKIGQAIGKSEDSFYISNKTLYLMVSTDKEVYKPGATITITVQVHNTTATVTDNLRLVLKKNGSPILTENFYLQPNGSITFTLIFTAQESFALEGILGDERVVSYVEVVASAVEVITAIPEIVGREEFDASVVLKSTTRAGAKVRLMIEAGEGQKDFGTITLTGYESRLFREMWRLDKDGTMTIRVSGDVEKLVSMPIRFGERIETEVTPLPLYPEGSVVVPFSLTNIGELNSEVEVTFILQKEIQVARSPAKAPSASALMSNSMPDWCRATPRVVLKGVEGVKGVPAQANPRRAASPQPSSVVYNPDSVVMKRVFYVPVGTCTRGELIYELDRGSYSLSHASFFGTSSRQFRVAKLNEIEMDVNVMDLRDDRIPVNVQLRNIGANDFKGRLKVDTGFYRQAIDVDLSSLQ